MCKEIISLHIGQAGVQSSHALWELICMEHGIGADGILAGNHDDFHYPGENIKAMYYEIRNSRFVPRAVLMDLEPTVIDEVRTGAYRQLWNPSNLVNQKEDAASNYARGYYTCGKLFITIAIDRINREIERCDNLSAFEIVHSYAGGTGSGFTSLLNEKLSESYGKVFKFSLGVFPSPRLSEIMVESYNALLHTHTTLENEDCVVLFDNESLFKKSLDKLGVSQPTFSLMNRLISQMFSSISLSHRYNFFGSQHADVTELLTNLVPYPRIHFPMMSYSPLISYDQQNHELYNCSRLTNDVFRDYNHVLQCSIQGNRFMSCCMLYRGSLSPKPIVDAIAKIKSNRDIDFVEWCPTGFKIGINTCPPIQVPHSEQAIGENALCMISGNTAIRQTWSGLVKKFDMLMSKRAFVHWYVSEGLEEGEFMDAREDAQSLVLDYDELSSQNTVEANNFSSHNSKTNINTNLSNIKHSVLSNVTNSRLHNEIFKGKYNKLFFPDETEEIELESSAHVDHLSNNKFIPKLINQDKDLEKKRFVNTFRSDISRPVCPQVPNNNNINKQFKKCQKTIWKSHKIIDEKKSTAIANINRNRHYTKDLEIKDIQSTITRYLGINPHLSETEPMKQKSIMIPLKRKPTSIESMLKIIPSATSSVICQSDGNTSQSNSSSRDDFLQKYELMKNNNKDKSNVTSVTGSCKTALDIENKKSLDETKKSIKNRFIYRTVNTRRTPYEINSRTNSNDFLTNKKLLRLSRPNYANRVLNTKYSTSINESQDEKESQHSQFEESKPCSDSEVTKLGNEVKFRYLEYSKIEIIICDPLYSIETSSSFTFM